MTTILILSGLSTYALAIGNYWLAGCFGVLTLLALGES